MVDTALLLVFFLMWSLTVLVTDFLKVQYVRYVKRRTSHSEKSQSVLLLKPE